MWFKVVLQLFFWIIFHIKWSIIPRSEELELKHILLWVGNWFGWNRHPKIFRSSSWDWFHIQQSKSIILVDWKGMSAWLKSQHFRMWGLQSFPAGKTLKQLLTVILKACQSMCSNRAQGVWSWEVLANCAQADSYWHISLLSRKGQMVCHKYVVQHKQLKILKDDWDQSFKTNCLIYNIG